MSCKLTNEQVEAEWLYVEWLVREYFTPKPNYRYEDLTGQFVTVGEAI